MEEIERESFRDALLSSIEPSDELKKRLDKQIGSLLRRKLSTAEKIRNVFLGVVFTLMSGIFAYVVYFVTTAQDKGLTPSARLFMCFGFAAGAIVFLTGAVYAIRELRAGRTAPRRQQQMMIGVSAGFVLLLWTSLLTFAPRWGLPTEKLILMNTAMLFYWIMAVGFVLAAKSQWQHEDALLEQKRTQLEIALLRQELKKAVSLESSQGNGDT